MNNVTPTTPSVFEAPDAVKAIGLSRADTSIKLSAELFDPNGRQVRRSSPRRIERNRHR